MTSNRPYLLRALFEWIVDNDATPYVVVAADAASVIVPTDYVADGRIVLNISPAAVRELRLENDTISFTGRFSGQPFLVSAPIGAVTAIYAKESGEGMMFNVEESESTDPADAVAASGNDRSSAPALKLVK